MAVADTVVVAAEASAAVVEAEAVMVAVEADTVVAAAEAVGLPWSSSRQRRLPRIITVFHDCRWGWG
ncbi:MAG: hypothetical protein ACEQSM_07415 [Aliarcobacter sp.]